MTMAIAAGISGGVVVRRQLAERTAGLDEGAVRGIVARMPVLGADIDAIKVVRAKAEKLI